MTVAPMVMVVQEAMEDFRALADDLSVEEDLEQSYHGESVEDFPDMETHQVRPSIDHPVDPNQLNQRFYRNHIGRRQLPIRRYNDLFVGNRRPENSESLTYVKPNDENVLEYAETDVQEGLDFWRFTLIGILIGQEPIYQVLLNFARGICVFRFDTLVDMQLVLDEGPWTVNGIFPLLLRQ